MHIIIKKNRIKNSRGVKKKKPKKTEKKNKNKTQ